MRKLLYIFALLIIGVSCREPEPLPPERIQDTDTKDGVAVLNTTNQDGFSSNIASIDGVTLSTAGGGPTAPVYGGSYTTANEHAGNPAVSFAAPTITGSNVLLIITASWNGEETPTAITAEYNSVDISSTEIDAGFVDVGGTSHIQTWLYYVINPTSAATVDVSLSTTGTGNLVVIATYYTGVHQTTPIRTATTGNATTNPASLAVTNSQTGDLIFGVFGLNDTSLSNGLTSGRIGAGQTFRAQEENTTSEVQISFGEEAGASGTVTHSWDFVNNVNNGSSFIAVPLVPAS